LLQVALDQFAMISNETRTAGTAVDRLQPRRVQSTDLTTEQEHKIAQNSQRQERGTLDRATWCSPRRKSRWECTRCSALGLGRVTTVLDESERNLARKVRQNIVNLTHTRINTHNIRADVIIRDKKPQQRT